MRRSATPKADGTAQETALTLLDPTRCIVLARPSSAKRI